MTAGVARAGWLLTAIFFATILSSLLHVTHVGWIPIVLLAGFAAIACRRPRAGMLVLLVLVPSVWYLASHVWNTSVAWAEVLACAGLIGLALDALIRPSGFGGLAGGAGRVPAAIGAPAILFGALVLASLAAALGVLGLKFGPAFAPLLTSQLTREYFTDARTFPALHAAMLLLEGTLLCAHGARLAAERPMSVNAARALAFGGAVSATCTVLDLLQKAWHRPSFFAAIGELAGTQRWNAHYPDHNAAGSYYAMAVIVAAALAWRERGAARAAWSACTVLIVAALWLTSSRIALLAVLAAAAAAFLLPQLTRGRAAVVRVAALAAAACAILVLIAVLLPQKGLQQGAGVSTDVRIGLIQTGLRMIRTHPAFGVGLGEFYPRSAQYSSPALLAKFPAIAARGENAHNNFVQIAAELGIAGGVLFAWLVAAALIAATRHALDSGDRFLLLATAGVGAFALTLVGGHALLIPEPGYMFWAMAGIVAGTRTEGSRGLHGRHGTAKVLSAIALLAIVATVPWRTRALERDADLEHVGINLSAVFDTSPDGIKYKSAKGWATLFVPAGAFKVSINVRSDHPVRLEARLGGRVANVVTLPPGTWFDFILPARTERAVSRFVPLDLRLLDADETVMWITKVQPIE